MNEPNSNHFLFYRGNTFYFSSNIEPRQDQHTLTYDGYTHQGLGDGHFGELAFVKKEGRIGIFLLDSADDYYGNYLYRADTFPFMYDEIWIPDYTGQSDAYLPFRIGTKWGVIKLLDHQNYKVDYKGWCVPWEYATRQEAINAIRAKYDITKITWRNAMNEY